MKFYQQCQLRVEIFRYNKNSELRLAMQVNCLKQACNPLNLYSRIQPLIRINTCLSLPKKEL